MKRLQVPVTDNIATMCAQAERVLASAPDVDLYQQGSSLVQILDRANGPSIEAVRLPTLAKILSGAIEFTRTKMTKDGPEEYGVIPPKEVVAAISSAGRWSFREIRGLIQAPTLRTDGSLLSRPGFDAASGLYYAPQDGITFVVKDTPTAGDVSAALATLEDAFVDFPFAAPEFRSACFASLLTILVRPSIVGSVPIFAFEAPARGSGKSLLASYIGIITTGREIPASPQPRDEDEDCKRITIQIARGSRIIWIDNVVGRFGSGPLAALITSPYWDDRVIGGSEMGPWPNLVVWLVTGNNLYYHQELVRRVIPIFIDTQLERPEERSGFKHPDALAFARQNRGAIVSAALTVLRGYLAAGAPSQSLVPYGSFEGWSSWVRNALVWIGLPDPYLTRSRLSTETDTEEDAFGRMMAVWYLHFGTRALSVREAVDEKFDDLNNTFKILAPSKNRSEEVDVRGLGYAFNRCKGHPTAGLRCVAVGKGDKGQTYRIQKASEPQGVLLRADFEEVKS